MAFFWPKVKKGNNERINMMRFMVDKFEENLIQIIHLNIIRCVHGKMNILMEINYSSIG